MYARLVCVLDRFVLQAGFLELFADFFDDQLVGTSVLVAQEVIRPGTDPRVAGRGVNGGLPLPGITITGFEFLQILPQVRWDSSVDQHLYPSVAVLINERFERPATLESNRTPSAGLGTSAVAERFLHNARIAGTETFLNEFRFLDLGEGRYCYERGYQQHGKNDFDFHGSSRKRVSVVPAHF